MQSLYIKKYLGQPPPPPPRKNCGKKAFGKKLKNSKVVQKCLKWRENWMKMIFDFFDPPSLKKIRDKINGLKMKRKKTSSKFSEMVRKWIKNNG